jgi:multisubunit Na+/H+ antiporter MnhE subunit
MRRVLVALVLLADFLWHVVTAGVSTAWLIVYRGSRVEPRIIRVSYTGVSEIGAAFYACMLSLTPGTTAIDFDPATRTLLLHVLDGPRAAATVAAARARFERRFAVLFPG